MTKRDWAYESDEDLGEDLGQDVVNEDYEEELEDGDEEGAVKKPLTEEERMMKEAGL